jgi:hypothetical protein
MCMVSFVGDFYSEKWKNNPPTVVEFNGTQTVSRWEFELLRREVLQLKDMLQQAKKYDEENGEPDCEMEEKVELLRKIAKLVNVSLEDVL